MLIPKQEACIHNSDVDFLFSMIPNVLRLNIIYQQSLPIDILRKISEFEKLEELEMKGVHQVTNRNCNSAQNFKAGDSIVCEIIEKCLNLRILNVEMVVTLTDKTLFAIAKYGSHQKEILNLKNCPALTDEGVLVCMVVVRVDKFVVVVVIAIVVIVVVVIVVVFAVVVVVSLLLLFGVSL